MSNTQQPSDSNYQEIPTLFTQILQTLVNSALRYDPGTRAAIKELPREPLAVVSSKPSLQFYIATQGEQLELKTVSDRPAAVELKGDLGDILALVFTAKTSLANTGVTVKGNIGLLADYQRCFQNIDIDWEDALASALGSLPAHQLANITRHLFGNLVPNHKQAAAWLSDFIVEELRAVPASAQLQQFSKDVNTTRQRVERLQLRVQKLIQQQQQQ